MTSFQIALSAALALLIASVEFVACTAVFIRLSIWAVPTREKFAFQLSPCLFW